LGRVKEGRKEGWWKEGRRGKGHKKTLDVRELICYMDELFIGPT